MTFQYQAEFFKGNIVLYVLVSTLLSNNTVTIERNRFSGFSLTPLTKSETRQES